MSVRRVDQGMAAAAARLLPAQVTPELRTRYRQLRVMLHSAGLAATYAFIAAKAGPPGADGGLPRAYRQAAAGIHERLSDLGLLTGDTAQMTARDVLGQLGRMSAAQYTRASVEATAFMGWLARLADAVGSAGDDRTGGTVATSPAGATAGEDSEGRAQGAGT